MRLCLSHAHNVAEWGGSQEAASEFRGQAGHDERYPCSELSTKALLNRSKSGRRGILPYRPGMIAFIREGMLE